MARTKEEATSAVSTPNPPKRRGRPPKDASAGAVKKAYTPTGRPRGRPPKGDVAVPRKPPSGRPRGRPKGSTKKKEEPVDPNTPKRTRGRPRKSDAGTPATTNSKPATPATTTPKGRGRPKKAVAKVEDEDVDAEADADVDADADMDAEADQDEEDGSDTGSPLSEDDGATGKKPEVGLSPWVSGLKNMFG